jgi:hypothetical protein
MSSHDILMILVFTFPMFLFTIYPGILASNYLADNYDITESKKRAVMVSITFLSALIISTLLYYI